MVNMDTENHLCPLCKGFLHEPFEIFVCLFVSLMSGLLGYNSKRVESILFSVHFEVF